MDARKDMRNEGRQRKIVLPGGRGPDNDTYLPDSGRIVKNIPMVPHKRIGFLMPTNRFGAR